MQECGLPGGGLDTPAVEVAVALHGFLYCFGLRFSKAL